jgi:DNA-binding response OmpR family regulator
VAAVAPRKTVLVVEDDAALRKVLELRLTLEGFHVTLAEDGEQGLRALDATCPDAVITDLMMPRVDGFAFCNRAREIEAHADLPIVVLSAHQRDADVDRLLELGNIVFMPKPFDAPTLTATLRELVSNRDTAQARAS